MDCKTNCACHGALEMTKLFQFGILFVLLKIHHILQIATNRLGSWNSSCLILLVVTNTQCQSYTPFQVILLINVKFIEFSYVFCDIYFDILVNFRSCFKSN